MSQNATAMKMRIMYKGQELRFPALLNRKTGDLVQLEDVKAFEEFHGEEVPYTIEAGARWSTNRETYRRSKGATQYHCFKRGDYDEVRSLWHVDQGYKKATQDVLRHGDAVRSLAVDLMAHSASLGNPQLWVISKLDPLIEAYQRKYNIRNIMALQDMERGKRLRDALGRINIPAACFAQGAAQGNLQKRDQAIHYIESCMTRRVQEVLREIDEVRDAYRRVRCSFKPEYANVWAREDAGRRLPPEKPQGIHVRGWQDDVRDRRRWPYLAQELEWHLPFFKGMKALPFRRNATHVVDDMQQALEAIQQNKARSLVDALLKLREGIRWFFALDHLEMQVIAPLSLLAYDLELRSAASLPLGAEKPKFVPKRAMASRDFRQIVCQYSKFAEFVELFDDGILKHSRQDDVLTSTQFATKAMKDDDWLAAKEHLLSITDIL
ncbi:MAG: hypothetical protein ACYC44_01535 [Patescibacteria group bacterium]